MLTSRILVPEKTIGGTSYCVAVLEFERRHFEMDGV